MRCLAMYLTEHFTFFEPWNQEIGELCVVKKRRLADSEAPKMWTFRSGKYIQFVIVKPRNEGDDQKGKKDNCLNKKQT